MKDEKDSSLKIEDFYQRTKDLLRLKPVLGRVGFSGKISHPSSKDDSLSIQVWGKKEIRDFNTLSSRERREALTKRLKDDTLCIILADGLSFIPEVKEEARKRKVALFFSELSQRKCREKTKDFFSFLSPDGVLISGGVLKISGLGILIVGDSGVGKSESALELISRGHQFVCDDVVHVKRTTSDKLIGTAPRLSRYFMEIRGLGIINIKEIFGPKAVNKQTGIDLVIRLKKWQRGKEYNRLDPKFTKDYEILGVKLRQIIIPVALGRNIATLIEVACKVHVLGEKGYHASQELVKKLNRVLTFR